MYIRNGHIDVESAHLGEYLELIAQHASLAQQEPGVARFDVLQNLDDPNLIHTIEVYDRKEAWTRYASQPYAVEFMSNPYVKRSVVSEARNLEPNDDEWR